MADEVTGGEGFDAEIARFFETGELTGGLAAEATPQIDEPTPTDPAPAVQPQLQPPPQQQQQVAEDPNLVMLRNQLGQLQNYSQNLERVIHQLQQAGVQQQPQQQEQIPDRDTDPLGYTMYELAEVKKMLSGITGQMQQQQEYQNQATQLQNFVVNARQQGEAFINATPDFPQAYAYLRNIRVSDMRDMGLNQQQIKEALVREELQVTVQAMRSGQNPAQFLYNIAKRYGYQQAPAQAAQPTPEERLAKIQQAAATTTQRIQPSGSPVDLSLDAVKGMASDQLDKLVEADDLWHKVVGGKAAGDSIFH